MSGLQSGAGRWYDRNRRNGAARAAHENGGEPVAQTFTSKDAKLLIQRHEQLSEQLEEICALSDEKKAGAVRRINELLLKDAFADFARKELEKGEAQEALPSALQPLAEGVYGYVQSVPISGTGRQLIQEYEERIQREKARLKPATGGLRWLFASSGSKTGAEEAYRFLRSAAQGTYAREVESLSRQMEALERTDRQAALANFQGRRSDYREILRDMLPNAEQAGRPVSRVSRLLEKSRALQGEIASAHGAVDAMAGAIRAAVDRLLASTSLELLKSVPVEEIGREQSGIRFKALRDNGYETVADVYCATQAQLESVRGISEEGSWLIKKCAREYAERVTANTKIRLSADDRTPDATRLVSAICDYRRRSAIVDSLDEATRAEKGKAERAMETLQTIGNGVPWAFMDVAERQKCIEDERYLTRLQTGAYAQAVETCTQGLAALRDADAKTAWEDFSRNSIAYYNVLETLVPGVLGNDDTRYGLPEELAREIQDECFFPEGLRCELRRYQEWGVKYILHQERVLLGDEMGLGKTVQAIAAMVSLRNTGATRFMVVCPASVLPNWCKEIGQKSRLRAIKVHGTGRMSAFREWQKSGGVAVTNFETTGYLKLEDDFAFDMLIVDEAHYIKNNEARRTKNVNALGEHAKRILFMTGTALENKVDEMIALVQVLRPEVASQLRGLAFMAAAPQFREKVAPVYYRRKREDVLTELPELIEKEEWCALLPEEKKIYQSSLRKKRYMEIRRVSWNADDLNASCKANRLKELVEEAAEDGRKVIVFSFFLETIAAVRACLGERCLPQINGSIPPQRRQEIIDEFERAPAGAVLPAQIQSGGTGLNIQAASVVILCEPQLKPSIENQAISRAYRMGQARNVLVYRLLCEKSIDERVMELLEEKQKVFDAFADESVSADATQKKEAEIDDKTFGTLVNEEIERINAENAAREEGA